MNKNQIEKMVQDRWLQGRGSVGDYLRDQFNRIKMPFLGLYAFAFFLYLPMIVLRLTNDMDGLWDQDDHVAGEAELRIGRWFWMHVARARFFVSMDPIPLVIALAVFVAGILLILSVLRLRFTFVGAVSCLLFLSSISLTAQMAYSYMAIEFSLSFLLAVLAVLVVERGKKAYLCIPLAGLCLSLSMGLYQASLGVCTLLILFDLLFRLLRGEESVRIRLFLARAMGAVLTGGILYFLLLKLHLFFFHTTLSDYGGAAEVSPWSILRSFPSSLKHTYTAVWFYFFNGLFQQNRFPDIVAHAAYLVPLLSLFLAIVLIGRHSIRRALLFAFLALGIPVFANSFFFLATNATTQPQMTIPMALILPLCLLFPGEIKTLSLPVRGLIRRLVCGAYLLGAFILLYGSIWMVETDFYAMNAGRRATMTLTESIINVLDAREIDYIHTGILIIGGPGQSETFEKDPLYAEANDFAQYGNWDGVYQEESRICWRKVFEKLYRLNIQYVTPEVMERFYQLPEVKAMPVYPAPGGIAQIYGVTVIKLTNEVFAE